MGYTTDFYGSLLLSRTATDVEKNYINTFSDTRRMKRDVNKLMELYEGKFGNPFATGTTPEEIYGVDGAFFVYDDGQSGQTHDASIIDYNEPPGMPIMDSNIDWQVRWAKRQELINEGKCQPGLWCQWVIEKGLLEKEDVLVWDGGEKFYEYVAWLKYLITNFFEPWGIKLNGEITWEGEENDDFGKIVVTNNVVEIKVGKKIYE